MSTSTANTIYRREESAKSAPLRELDLKEKWDPDALPRDTEYRPEYRNIISSTTSMRTSVRKRQSFVEEVLHHDLFGVQCEVIFWTDAHEATVNSGKML